MSDSVQPHGLQPTRLLRPWDSPGKNTGVGCHFLLQCMKVESESEVAQSCLTLSDPMDCSPPGSSIHGIFRATVLEWGAISILRAANSQGRWDSKSGWAKSGFPWGSLQRFTVSLIHSVLKRRNTEALPCQHPGAPERKSR